MSSQIEAHTVPAGNWRGFGPWNAFFIAKLILFVLGTLDFDPYYNVLFAAALLLPMPSLRWHRFRQVLAIPAGIALLYHDTWFPPISRLTSRSEVLQFSFVYIIELLERFIDWKMVGAAFIFAVVYLFVSQWLRLTAFSVLALCWFSLSGLIGITLTFESPVLASPGESTVTTTQGAITAIATKTPAAKGPPGTGELDSALQAFFTSESKRVSTFPDMIDSSGPFDILFLSVCSMSWADLQVSGLADHPLFGAMDVVFDNFNSATSYSGPAALRLLRASCGQPPHDALYQPADQQCYLFDHLRRLGYESQAVLNHDGRFPGFVQPLGSVGKFPAPQVPVSLKPRLRSFDGSPIWGDLDTLSDWWKRREASGAERMTLLYNSVTVHDGNREPLSDGGSRRAPFELRARKLLDDFSAFIAQLEQSGRRVLVILVPEHGAGLEGDRMQIPGMREIPSPAITRVPAAVRLVGSKAAHDGPVRISDPTSLFALSDLVARVLSDDLFDRTQIDWEQLAQALPRTPLVSENEGSVLMLWDGEPYIRMGKGGWMPYPK